MNDVLELGPKRESGWYYNSTDEKARALTCHVYVPTGRFCPDRGTPVERRCNKPTAVLVHHQLYGSHGYCRECATERGMLGESSC